MAEPRKKTAPDTPPHLKPLTVRERLFVQEFLVDRNATRAYLAVFGQDARHAAAQGPMLRREPHVQAEIEAATAAQVRRARIRADEVLREIARIAFSDPAFLVDERDRLLPIRQIPLEARRAIRSIRRSRERVTITREGRTRTTVRESTVEYTFCDKLAALNVLVEVMGLKKAPLPPLETLLTLLPPQLAQLLRAHLAAASSPPPSPVPMEQLPAREVQTEPADQKPTQPGE